MADGQSGNEKKPKTGLIEAWGQVMPIEQVALHSRIMAFVAESPFDIGDGVKKGDLLAKLHGPELESDVKKHQALVRKAEIAVRGAKQAVAILDAALERSKAELGAAKAVAARKSAAAEVEEARMNVAVAEAVVKESAARREQGIIAVELAEIELVISREELARTEFWRESLEIRAPFDGVVVRRSIFVGDLVRPPTNDKSEPLLVVTRMDRVRVFVDLPEKDAVNVDKGAAAYLFTVPDIESKGVVTRVVPIFNPDTRTMQAIIELPNADSKLYPGTKAKVFIVPKKK